MADELAALRTAAKGLLYPSDTDAPIEVVSDVTPPENAKMSSVDKFFDALKESDDAAKFEKLRKAVASTLADVKVYRVGSTEIDVYVLGKTTGGAVAGLKTKSVET